MGDVLNPAAVGHNDLRINMQSLCISGSMHFSDFAHLIFTFIIMYCRIVEM